MKKGIAQLILGGTLFASSLYLLTKENEHTYALPIHGTFSYEKNGVEYTKRCLFTRTLDGKGELFIITKIEGLEQKMQYTIFHTNETLQIKAVGELSSPTPLSNRCIRDQIYFREITPKERVILQEKFDSFYHVLQSYQKKKD